MTIDSFSKSSINADHRNIKIAFGPDLMMGRYFTVLKCFRNFRKDLEKFSCFPEGCERPLTCIGPDLQAHVPLAQGYKRCLIPSSGDIRWR